MAKKAKVETSTPFWRDNRIIPILLQTGFAVAVVLAAWYLISNAISGLRAQGLNLGLGFLQNAASFTIEESMIDFQPTDTYLRAILVGILNTLKVAVIGIALTTILGVLIGIGRLSDNWLVRKICGMYVEIIRNTPLLVQMVIWYFAVFLQLPKIENSMHIGPVYLNNRGAAIPWFQPHSGTLVWMIFLVAGIIAALFLWKFLLRAQERVGKRKYPLLWAMGSLLVAVLIPLLLTQSGPFTVDNPEMGKFNFEGGYLVSANFMAVLIALVVYTASYIAEIVRAGIQSVSAGQREAARALGLKSSTTMRLVVLPQAFRVIVPPMTNQYLNLTKNSSLAIAVGYRDIVSIANPIMSQTGHVVEMITIMILVYLIISIITSILMNLFNKKTQIVER
ncbi:ABC transporter permease subunit [Sporolactobacillus sp. Y61]|uniref:ABC transporter permease subunit n=1 Tax=Sporolactobacillus sp. Y61 TaxID=3160863 RepID=A0AAU8IJ42_9BACL